MGGAIGRDYRSARVSRGHLRAPQNRTRPRLVRASVHSQTNGWLIGPSSISRTRSDPRLSRYPEIACAEHSLHIEPSRKTSSWAFCWSQRQRCGQALCITWPKSTTKIWRLGRKTASARMYHQSCCTMRNDTSSNSTSPPRPRIIASTDGTRPA